MPRQKGQVGKWYGFDTWVQRRTRYNSLLAWHTELNVANIGALASIVGLAYRLGHLTSLLTVRNYKHAVL